MGTLKEINELFIDTISDGTYTSRFDKLISEYSEFINNFFVDKKDSICKIYNIIKDNSMPYNKVTIVDVPAALTMYSDYYNGLVEFADKVTCLKDTDNIDSSSIQNVLSAVSTKDSEFINSIFGGERNPQKEVSINEAMLSVEAFLKIKEMFGRFATEVQRLSNIIIENDCSKYDNEVTTGIRIFLISNSTFICNALQEVVHAYENIMSSINSRTPVSGVQKPETYQLF